MTLQPHSAYTKDDAVEAFYGNRSTDGGRPEIYSEIFDKYDMNRGVLVSLGCGDSRNEKAIFEFGKKNLNYYIGIDVSQKMLDLSERNLSGSTIERIFLRERFDSDLMNSRLKSIYRELGISSDNVTIAMLGRTFGNYEPCLLFSSLRMYITDELLVVDSYGGSNKEIPNFESRMKEISTNSSGFFQAALRGSGFESVDDNFDVRFSDENYYYTAIFNSKKHTRDVFSIRYIIQERVSEFENEHDISIRRTIPIPGQLLPMLMLEIELNP